MKNALTVLEGINRENVLLTIQRAKMEEDPAVVLVSNFIDVQVNDHEMITIDYSVYRYENVLIVSCSPYCGIAELHRESGTVCVRNLDKCTAEEAVSASLEGIVRYLDWEYNTTDISEEQSW